jgi:hypothetical protein
MSSSAVTTYYVRLDSTDTYPMVLYRRIVDDVERKLKEHIWDKVEKEWKLTSRVTESMFKGGDIEPTTEEVARQYYPEAFKV